MASFVDTLLRGGSPSLSEFLTQQAMTQPQAAPQPQPGPPIERAGSVQPEAPAQSPIQSALQKFLGNPMLLNVLAQQGHSLTPGPSPLGVVGRAGLATNQQNMASERAGLENEFLRAKTGLAQRDAEGGGVNSNVQSTFEGANGNMWLIKRDGGPPIDTGIKFSTRVQLVERADGSVAAIDTTTGQAIGSPITPEEASQAAIRDATNKDVAQATVEAPSQFEETGAVIDNAQEIIRQLETGELDTGFFRGRLPAVTTQEQLFDVFSGGTLLDQISSVTLGALSKGEMDFLKTTVTNRTNTPEANIEIIKRKIEMLQRANKRVEEKTGISNPGNTGSASDAQSRIDSL